MNALSREQIHTVLAARLGEALGPLMAAKDPFAVVRADRLVDAARLLRDDPALHFDFLQDLTATDHPKEALIRVVLHFYSYQHRHLFVLKVEVPRSAASVPSLTPLWPAANWMEREVFDLFGVQFEGHPDLRRILTPEDWKGHPLRKDYVEQGGYHDISNVRDNPLDLYLQLDRARRVPVIAPVPAAPTKER